jgi:hypothetical protein
MLLHIINIISFLILLIILIISPLPFPLFIIFIPLIFLYNLFYIRLVNHSKEGCNRFDFFTFWGINKINNNTEQYLDEKHAKIFTRLLNLQYLFPIIFLISIIAFVIYALYFS